jgi:hypothetical protein
MSLAASSTTTAKTQADLPALTLARVDQILDTFDDHADELVLRAKLAFGHGITKELLRTRLADTRAALASPKEAVTAIHAMSFFHTAAHPLPLGFTFAGIDLANIPIDPGDKKFEEWGDWLGWIIHTGEFVFGYPAGAKAAFRFHDAPTVTSGFVYELRGQEPDADFDVALFGDFGCGLYHSLYIAKQLVHGAFPYAIHLGDVYYAGREQEFVDFFKKPLAPLLGETRLFTMNGNHEMFSQAVPYFRYLDERRAHPSGLQEQEGSYFCLRGKTAQIIAIDTDYFGYRRYADEKLRAWLAAQLAFGREHGLVNVLLSGDEPLEYKKTDTTPLLADLSELVVTQGLVDVWFWGNTHYCALFDRSDALPFVGSCIGHAGHPFPRYAFGEKCAAPVRWVETAPRFPASTGLRQDQGDNGYCVLRFASDGSLRITYLDWMANVRCVAVLSMVGGKLSLTSVDAR